MDRESVGMKKKTGAVLLTLVLATDVTLGVGRTRIRRLFLDS
jgi:hypothetical protein